MLEHKHKWYVFSTCITTVELMLQCRGCGQLGFVHNPTLTEWGEAFHAPSSPYEWTEPDRVSLTGKLHTPEGEFEIK